MTFVSGFYYLFIYEGTLHCISFDRRTLGVAISYGLEFSTQIVVVVVARAGRVGDASLRKDLLDVLEFVVFLDLGNLFVVFGFFLLVLFVQSLQVCLEFGIGLLGQIGNRTGGLLKILVGFGVNFVDGGLFIVRAGIHVEDTADGFGNVRVGKFFERFVVSASHVVLGGGRFSPGESGESL